MIKKLFILSFSLGLCLALTNSAHCVYLKQEKTTDGEEIPPVEAHEPENWPPTIEGPLKPKPKPKPEAESKSSCFISVAAQRLGEYQTLKPTEGIEIAPVVNAVELHLGSDQDN